MVSRRSACIVCVLVTGSASCNELAGIHAPLDEPELSSNGASAGAVASAGTEAGSVAGASSAAAGDGGFEPANGGARNSAGTSGKAGSGGSGAVQVTAVAHAFPEWPIPNPPSTGLPNPQTYDTATTSGIVVDRVTGLSWQRNIARDLRSATDAQNYCQGLKLSGTGWRLPTRIELLSLLDVSAHSPLLDVVVFPETPTDHGFWSTSPVAGDGSSTWSVDFGFGDGLAYVSPRAANLYARCVRDANVAEISPRYTSQDGFVSDEGAQLLWEQPIQTSTFSLQQAKEYCSSLSVDGGGWRLPSINELQSLIDESRRGPAIDPEAFPSTPVDFFWTLSAVTGFQSYGWTVSFDNGAANFFDGSQQHAVRCVR